MNTPIAATLVLLLGAQAAQDSRPVVPEVPAVTSQPEAIEVRLTARVPEGRRGLRWSPKGARIALAPESMRGELMLGDPERPWPGWPLGIQLTKSKPDGHHDRLWLDHDGDGRRGPGEELSTAVSENRGKFWSSFETVLELPLPVRLPAPAAAGVKDATDLPAATRAYPLSFWYVFDPAEPDAEPVLRWSRRGWHAGRFELGGSEAFLLITESRMDGRFDRDDAWWLSSDGEQLASGAGSRSLGRHAWLGEQAFRMLALDPDGTWIRIEAFDPGETRAEEQAREDLLAVDRNAPRAPAPLAFRHDFEAAAAAALVAEQPLLIDFETTWCGPCKQMDSWVYSAAKVVDAAESIGLIGVKVDGDERRDLKQRFGVEAYPTMILLSGQGVELRRAVGYQSVEEMAAFLAPRPRTIR